MKKNVEGVDKSIRELFSSDPEALARWDCWIQYVKTNCSMITIDDALYAALTVSRDCKFNRLRKNRETNTISR